MENYILSILLFTYIKSLSFHFFFPLILTGQSLYRLLSLTWETIFLSRPNIYEVSFFPLHSTSSFRLNGAYQFPWNFFLLCHVEFRPFW